MNRKRLLIVEDESIVAMALEQRLLDMGHEVVGVVDSGTEAIAAAVRTHPDLILMDIQLKEDMDGIEAARQIRSRLNIPVIYLTAHADETTISRAKITEPFGYITKPINDRDLRVNIEIALYKHQTERALQERELWLATTLKSIGEGVIATDSKGTVLFLNPVAEQISGWRQTEVIGLPFSTVFRLVDEDTGEPVPPPVEEVIRSGQTTAADRHVCLQTKSHACVPVTCTTAAIKYDSGEVVGAVVVFQDITLQRHAEAEREQLITELQDALGTIKILSGIIPICASCKKIRDTEGHWVAPEVYLSERSRAEFSHGICPDCAKKLYPDLYDGDEIGD